MSSPMPVIFVGHGSPMNIIANNDFTKSLASLGAKLPHPTAIIVISAHWWTEGSLIHASNSPQTIYDFYGFPDELYKVDYKTTGAYPYLQNKVSDEQWKMTGLVPTSSWGLDHGAWAILHHMFPDRDIPVTQISLNSKFSFQEHFNLAQKIKFLREQGFLIICSGNVVHNLRQIKWEPDALAAPWALEFENQVLEMVLKKDRHSLVDPYQAFGETFSKSHPSFDHYVPLIYAVGLANDSEMAKVNFKQIQNSTISMLSFSFGL